MEVQKTQNLNLKPQNYGSKPKSLLRERSYSFSIQIIRFLETLRSDFSSQIISKQLLRSATSVGAYIIEAKANSSRKDFANFFNHALKSSNESEYWLSLLRDSKKADVGLVEKSLGENRSLSRILGSSLLTLRGKNQTLRS